MNLKSQTRPEPAQHCGSPNEAVWRHIVEDHTVGETESNVQVSPLRRAIWTSRTLDKTATPSRSGRNVQSDPQPKPRRSIPELNHIVEDDHKISKNMQLYNLIAPSTEHEAGDHDRGAPLWHSATLSGVTKQLHESQSNRQLSNKHGQSKIATVHKLYHSPKAKMGWRGHCTKDVTAGPAQTTAFLRLKVITYGCKYMQTDRERETDRPTD